LKKRASSAIALAAATGLWVTLDQTAIPPTPAETENEQDIVESYLESAQIWRYDIEGNRESLLAVGSAEVPGNKPVIRLSSIEFEGMGSSAKSWVDSGVLWDDNHRLNLEGSVVMHSPSDDVYLHTEQMNLDFREQTARSSGLVTIDAPEGTTRGDGMDADLGARTFRLRKNVETVIQR
jgi:LPS export ABC transporter protein LptC